MEQAALIETNNEDNAIVDKVAETPELLEKVLRTPQASGVISMLVQQQLSFRSATNGNRNGKIQQCYS